MTTQTAHLRTVAAPPMPEVRSRPQRYRRARPWGVFVVVVIVAFFGLTYSRISLDRSAFLLDSLEDQISTEEARHFDLRLEVAELRDPQRIADEAASLGLVFPGERVELAVEHLDEGEVDPEYRWAQLRALLSAQP